MLIVVKSYPNVPITLVETCVLAASASLASPKSATCVKTRLNYKLASIIYILERLCFD
jgi:hypothetical protein